MVSEHIPKSFGGAGRGAHDFEHTPRLLSLADTSQTLKTHIEALHVALDIIADLHDCCWVVWKRTVGEVWMRSLARWVVCRRFVIKNGIVGCIEFGYNEMKEIWETVPV